MRYSQKTEEFINLPILEVARELGITTLNNNKAYCFTGHDENSPSLSFNIKDNYFHCFGCHIGGNTIKLVMLFKNCNFIEACNWINNKFSISPPTSLSSKVNFKQKVSSNFSKKIAPHNVPDFEVYEWILKHSTLSTKGRKYFSQTRGFTDKTIEHFHLRDFPDAYAFLNMTREEWGLDRLIKSGLWIKDNSISRPVWFNHTLIFPFFNMNSRIEYLQGRLLYSTSNLRYLNLHNLPLPLFNTNVLKHLKPSDKLIICEGIPDTIWVYQKGLNSIGVLGASNFKKEYLKFLMDFEIYVLPDNDNGGDIFFCNLSTIFGEIDKKVKRITFDQKYKDISEYLLNKNETSK